jgi:hypothetical protein
LSVRLKEADASVLEDLLMPALSWRRGFLARTLRLGTQPIPGWLASRRLAGDFQIELLRSPPVELQRLLGRFDWTGPRVSLFLDKAEAGGGSLSGRILADLTTGEATYAADAAVNGYRWQGGNLDANGRLTTTGTGLKLLANAAASGLFTMRLPNNGDAAGFDRAAGCFDLTMRAQPTRFNLPCLELGFGEAVFGGEGFLKGFDRLELQLYRNGVPHRATGRLNPFHITVEESSGVR